MTETRLYTIVALGLFGSWLLLFGALIPIIMRGF